MKKIYLFIFVFAFATSFAQQKKALWTDDFSDATKWKITNQAGNNDNWIIGTQGPSGSIPISAIASTTASNGFALFDSNKLHDVNANDAHISSIMNIMPIDLTGTQYLMLSFQQYYQRRQDSTFLFISTDTINWTKFVINPTLPLFTPTATNPDTVKINISAIAANQPKVWLKFQFYSPDEIGDYSGNGFAWMIDDIKIETMPVQDIAVTKLVSPTPCGLSEFDTIKVKILNFSNDVITTFPIAYQFNNGAIVSETFNGELNPGDSLIYKFNSSINVMEEETYDIKVFTSYVSDINPSNDTLKVLLNKYAIPETPTITPVDITLMSSSETGNNWYNMFGQLLSTEKIFKPIQSGNYVLQVTQNGCSSSGVLVHFTAFVDVALTQLINPIGGCGLANNEKLIVKVKNLGNDTLKTFSINFKLDNEVLKTQFFDTLIANDQELTIILNDTLNLSALKEYNLKVFAKVQNDYKITNDSINVKFENGTPSVIPYSMGFETNQNFNTLWHVIDNNNDNIKWAMLTSPAAHSGNSFVRYGYNPNKKADDWLISGCMQLSSNKAYRVSFYYKAHNAGYPEKLRVTIGKSPSIVSMYDTLIELNSITNTTYQKTYADFTVNAEGAYYIGLQANSDAKRWYLYIDDFALDTLSQFDASVVSVQNPTNCCIGIADTITVVIKNNGSAPISNFNVAYKIGTQNEVSTTFTGVLNFNETTKVNFPNTFSVSNPGNVNIKAYTLLQNDGYTSNDTLNAIIKAYSPLQVPMSTGFEATEDFTKWKILDLNSDAKKLKIITNNAYAGNSCLTYEGDTNRAANDLIITPCISLIAETPYKTSFWYKVAENDTIQNVKIYIGSAPHIDSLKTLLLELDSNFTTTYQKIDTAFKVTKTGTYYAGIYVTTSKGAKKLYIDDFRITGIIGIEELVANDKTIKLYPNPSKYYINIKSENPIESYFIFDINGNMIFNNEEKIQHSTKIDVSTLQSGSYFIQFKTEKGYIMKKFIKE